MVCVDGGEARLTFHRAPNADEERRLRVSAFCLGRTEVTVAAYDQCVRAGACEAAPTRATWYTKDDELIAEDSKQCNADRADRADHPINCVDFEQARRYCAFRGERLPRAMEWAWAAQDGSTEHRYAWGDDEPAARICWSGARQRRGTCAVGQHPAGADRWGVLDLDGNVSEWVDSTSGVEPASARAPTSGALLGWWPPEGPRQGIGGYSFRDQSSNGKLVVHGGDLVGDTTFTRDRRSTIGFRCARDL